MRALDSCDQAYDKACRPLWLQMMNIHRERVHLERGQMADCLFEMLPKVWAGADLGNVAAVRPVSAAGPSALHEGSLVLQHDVRECRSDCEQPNHCIYDRAPAGGEGSQQRELGQAFGVHGRTEETLHMAVAHEMIDDPDAILESRCVACCRLEVIACYQIALHGTWHH